MARRVKAALSPLLLLLATCLLFQVSGCSRPPPSAAPLEARHRNAESGFLSTEAANNGKTEGAHGAGRREKPPAASAESHARDDEYDGVASSQRTAQRSGRAPVRAGLGSVLHSKLARRFLVGEEEAGSGTDAARPSCGSYNNHIGCVPPSKH